MAHKPPLMDLPIKVADGGFYDGFNKDVTITAKILLGTLIIWAIAFPDNASSVLNGISGFLLAHFATWYIGVVAFFIIACVLLAVIPKSGKLILGLPGDKPEFSNFS